MSQHDYEVIRFVTCREFGVPESLIKTRYKDPTVCDAKRVIYKILRDQGLSFREIGDATSKDHSTATNGIRTHENLVSVDKVYSDKFDRIRKELRDLGII